MAKADPKVAALNASIEARLSRYVSDRRHIAAASAHDRVQRKLMQEHQPESGQWGAPCLGDHAEPTPWPCDSMKSFDNPLAYMD
ncbi:hypothetical protein B7C42_07665 [Nocardia cerradoensis]|uniref:Uncharacterized protein n=1 Tax=Nocardia cerradoensis TaxID=85688 RepID=A0A231GUD6_9NOCA|nr:hypothetical protein [Nocardia cerradoensis]OXR40240.1 hypothetical protein B7C42_07665 [Nocardia cerradoensis]